MLDKIISYSFYLLFFLTPLFWTSLNYELFEFNKMILTYGITTLIAGAWLLKIINHKSLIINRTPLDIPLLLFLASQILSTIFSIDPHTSIWGYYSRLNGGLLSTITYLFLYWAFVSNMDFEKVKRTLQFGLLSGAIISLWAISEHFGISPSCVILRGEYNDACWVQDVQARVFATLGQPNWLAGYLAMLIFPALYFFLTATTRFHIIYYYTLLAAFYLSFTFTYSRGPTLGLIGGMIVFLALSLPHMRESKSDRKMVNWIPVFAGMTKSILFILASFLFINLLFGSSLTSFRLVSKFAAPPRPSIELPPSTVTQLENGGTESGQIRFIVWKGAVDIFKHNPLFGSGAETFAYSYYQFRPVEHNNTSEWDFLYNKAHNEYLNYLATTGIVGFGAYMLMIGTFMVWGINLFKDIILSETKDLKIKKQSRGSSLIVRNDKITLIIALLASYISYLIYNFFLFSVVILAIFFFLFPAMAFVVTESVKVYRLQGTFFNWIYRRPIYTKAAKGLIVISTLFSLYSIFQVWYADILFARGQSASDEGNPGKAYNLISASVDLNRGEPFYRSELAFNSATAALALESEDATLSADLKNEADIQMEYVLKTNPKNVSFWRTAVRTYFTLASLDKKYTDKTLAAIEKSIDLAPTDPKLYYNKAKILDDLERKDEALMAIKKAIQLKPDYLEATEQLKQWEEATKSSNLKS